jgi:integrative and conjugative element protein (TIGR02256 family)
VIQQDWGASHLEERPHTFWSGAGCRDISAVLPYSRILAHAGTLAEQVQLAAAQAAPVIGICQRNPSDGRVVVYDIETYPERCMKCNEFDVFVDAGVEQQLRELRKAAFPNETGGILLGYYDFNIKAAVVVCGLPAPPDSISTPTSFERGTDGLLDAVSAASTRTAQVVGYIGEWHSHPPQHSASPSKDDIIQLAHLALGMDADGLPGIQLIVGEQDLRVLQAKISS